jgi:hypothetical protein
MDPFKGRTRAPCDVLALLMADMSCGGFLRSGHHAEEDQASTHIVVATESGGVAIALLDPWCCL